MITSPVSMYYGRQVYGMGSRSPQTKKLGPNWVQTSTLLILTGDAEVRI